MWLEAFYASLVISAGCGATLAINALLPDETKRFLRFVEAEVSARFKRKPRHLSIEMAMHLDADVDMKWWDEEFEKLQRAIPTNVWTKFDDACASNPLPPTSAEFGGWLTNAEMAYSMSVLCDTVEAHSPKSTDDYDLTVDLQEHAQALSYAVSLGMVTTAEARKSIEGRLGECENCEYVELGTYGNGLAYRQRTAQCAKCLAQDIADRIKEVSGYWG